MARNARRTTPMSAAITLGLLVGLSGCGESPPPEDQEAAVDAGMHECFAAIDEDHLDASTPELSLSDTDRYWLIRCMDERTSATAPDWECDLRGCHEEGEETGRGWQMVVLDYRCRVENINSDCHHGLGPPLPDGFVWAPPTG